MIPSTFNYLKKTSDVRLQNGVYFNLINKSDTAKSIHVPLIFTDRDLLDIFLPNGNYKTKTFETLSYVTNHIKQQDGLAWSDPPDRLRQSETEGQTVLDIQGNAFTNVPPGPTGYVPRIGLEQRLLDELQNPDRHPIISLTGSGGIGKTSIAIIAIQEIANQDPAPYKVNFMD